MLGSCHSHLSLFSKVGTYFDLAVVAEPLSVRQAPRLDALAPRKLEGDCLIEVTLNRYAAQSVPFDRTRAGDVNASGA